MHTYIQAQQKHTYTQTYMNSKNTQKRRNRVFIADLIPKSQWGYQCDKEQKYTTYDTKIWIGLYRIIHIQMCISPISYYNKILLTSWVKYKVYVKKKLPQEAIQPSTHPTKLVQNCGINHYFYIVTLELFSGNNHAMTFLNCVYYAYSYVFLFIAHWLEVKGIFAPVPSKAHLIFVVLFVFLINFWSFILFVVKCDVYFH